MSDWLSDETRRWLRLKILDMRADLAAIRLLLALRPIEAKYDPNQPRVPRGNPDGGQWTRAGGGGGGPSLAERAERALNRTFWGGVHQSAEAVRRAEKRVDDWLIENFSRGLDAFLRENDEFWRGVVNKFGGEEALRTYDEINSAIASTGSEVGAVIREKVNEAVARGDITRDQADDIAVLVATAAAATTSGRRKRGGGSGRGKTPGESSEASKVEPQNVPPKTSTPRRTAPKVEARKPPRDAPPGSRAYKVGDNNIALSPAGKDNFHVSFEIHTDYQTLDRDKAVRNAQNAARARGKPGDVGFHTMAHRFFPGLEGTIVPGDAVLNASGWRKMENRIGKNVREGKIATGSIMLRPKNAKRPSWFEVRIDIYNSDGSIRSWIRENIPNVGE